MSHSFYQEVDQDWDWHFRAERKAHMFQQRMESLDTRLGALSKELKEIQGYEEQFLVEIRNLMQQIQTTRDQASEVELKVKVQACLVWKLSLIKVFHETPSTTAYCFMTSIMRRNQGGATSDVQCRWRRQQSTTSV